MSWVRGLPAISVRNPVFANALMITLLAGGIFAARNLVTETYPEFSLDRITVETAYPGASPEEVEEQVCTRIEQMLEGLPGVRKIWSQSSENFGLVVIELKENVDDPQLMMLEIKDRVDQINTFPDEVEQPIVREALVKTQVINVAVYGQAPEKTIKEVAQDLRQDLLGKEAISQVVITGVRDYEISIAVSREALEQYGLTLPEVTAGVAKNTLDLPAGTLRTHNEELTLRTTGQRYTAEDFRNLVVIARPDGTIIRLEQLADIRDGFVETYESGRYQGQPAAMLNVYKTPEQDTSTIAAIVRDYVAQQKSAMPLGLHLDVWADNSREVDARIDMLVKNGLMGMVLVVLVLTLFMDFRISVWVAVGLPVSFAGSLLAMHFFGITMNMISLFGLIIAIGIIVDDAIVITDAFRQRVISGETPALAAINGPADVGLPVLASSLTTIIAFMPLLFVVGIMGKLIAVLPVAVIAAIVFSSVEAFGILPAHLRHCMVRQQPVGRLAQWRTRMRRISESGMEQLVTRLYRPLLQVALRGRWVTVAIMLAILIVTCGLMAGGRIPFTLLPEIDGDTLIAQVRFPQGVPVEQTQAAAAQLEAAALRLNDPDVLPQAGDEALVRKRYTVIGEWSGWLNEVGSHLCEVTIELQPAEERLVHGDQIMSAWEEQTGRIPGVTLIAFERGQQGPTEKPLELRLLGDDLERLESAANDVTAKLREYDGVSGIEHDLYPGRREVRIRLKPLARNLGITLDDLARQLRAGFYGGEAVRIQREGEEVRVQVRYPEQERQSLADIDSLRITGADGSEISFLEVADYKIGRGYVSIRHQEGKRRVRITANVDQRRTNAENLLIDLERSYLRDLPQRFPGIEYRLEGQHAQMVESLRSLLWGLGLSLIAIYAILAAMLVSYYQPFVIMMAIPLGFVGAALGHFVMGYDLTIMSIFGMVALAGIVVNDSLVMLDAINSRVRSGGNLFEAIRQAGELRFRAVLLTTLTTVAGLAPLLVERSSQAQSLIPMAISLTFGLIAATLLTLVAVPVLYLVFNDARRFGRWLRRGGGYPTPEAMEMVH